MTKTLVLYSSKYGSTKKYAEWIAAELNGDACPISDFKQNTLAGYDAVVLGSGLYAGNIKGIDILINNYDTLRGKKLAIFTCGLADYTKSENINNIKVRLEEKIPENIRQNMKLFFLRGGIDYKGLSFIHRVMMAGMNMVEQRKAKKEGANASEETKEWIETYGKKVDFSDKASIAGILEYCRN